MSKPKKDVCFACKQLPRNYMPRVIYLTVHLDISSGREVVMICERCLMRLPNDVSDEVIKSSQKTNILTPLQTDISFNNMIVAALMHSSPQLNFSKDFCILLNSPKNELRKYKHKNEFAKELSSILSSKLNVYGAYKDGKKIESSEIEEILNCYAKNCIIKEKCYEVSNM